MKLMKIIAFCDVVTALLNGFPMSTIAILMIKPMGVSAVLLGH